VNDRRALRAAARARRSAALAAAPSAAASIRDHLLGSGLVPARAVVSGWWPLPGELDARPALEALLARGHTVALPVVLAPRRPLQFREWRPEDPLHEGPFGVREPTLAATTRVPDVVLVPLLAFDPRGHRLGYGGGYYDRTLRVLREAGEVLAVGLALAAQEVAELPDEPWDERLDALITEGGPRTFG
jgi:5-formyltetrahydrofolate cyclo-ligase